MNCELKRINPDEFTWDTEGHVRPLPATPSEKLRRNVQNLGRLVEPVHARQKDGELLVFDGWRRVQACGDSGLDVTTLVYSGLSASDALAKSLTLNDESVGVAKHITDTDREKALMHLATGERTTVNRIETPPKSLQEVKYKLGIRSPEVFRQLPRARWPVACQWTRRVVPERASQAFTGPRP